MKLKELGFRGTADRLFLLPAGEKQKSLLRHPHIHEADVLLVRGYADHEKGLAFQTLALGKKNGEDIVFLEGTIEPSVIPFRELCEEEAEIFSQEADAYRKQIDDLKESMGNEEVQKTRTMEFLDAARADDHPDIITVTLFKDGLHQEENQVKIEGLEPSMIIGVLLHEPEQNFGYHQGETVGFFVQQLEDGAYRCICNMNPSKKLTKKDLEDGRLLHDAIAEFDREHSNDSFIEVLECLRDSDIWIPCHMMVSEESDAPVRMVPEILRNQNHAFLPVFSSREEMKDFPDSAPIVQDSFLHALTLAEDSEEELFGIVINAFTEPFVLEKELFALVARLKTRIVEEETEAAGSLPQS